MKTVGTLLIILLITLTGTRVKAAQIDKVDEKDTLIIQFEQKIQLLQQVVNTQNTGAGYEITAQIVKTPLLMIRPEKGSTDKKTYFHKSNYAYTAEVRRNEPKEKVLS